jgi:hypothetical protein
MNERVDLMARLAGLTDESAAGLTVGANDEEIHMGVSGATDRLLIEMRGDARVGCVLRGGRYGG